MARPRRSRTLLLVLAFFLFCQWEVLEAFLRLGATPGIAPALRFGLVRVAPIVAGVLALGPFLHLPAMLSGKRLPTWVMSGLLTPSYGYILACVAYTLFGGAVALVRLAAGLGPASPAWAAAGLASPFALAAYGASTGQLWLRVERAELPLKGLGSELAGVKVVQLSDLHVGPFVGARRLARIVARVRALAPDLVVITGDIINAQPSEARLAAPLLASIGAPLGIYASLGNHDHFIDGDAVERALTDSGIRVLRNRGEVIRRGGSAFWLAGVDDTWTERADVDAALVGKPPGLPTLLLAHDPNLWPLAAARGVEVTLSGHTHGGQIGWVKLHPSLSLARLITPFVAGGYQRGEARLHVSRGTANTLPLRLGAPPEVGLFELVDPPGRI